MFWALTLIAGLFLLTLLFLYRKGRLDWRLRLAEAEFSKLAQQTEREELVTRKFLRTVYMLIIKGAATETEIVAYKAIDLLKLAYGAKLFRQDEPVHLMALVAALLKQEKPDLASAVLDAYRNLLRFLPDSTLSVAAEQLQTIGVLAMKAKQNFLAAKAAEIVLSTFEITSRNDQPPVIAAALKTIKTLGEFALRRNDTDFFRELAVRVRTFIFDVSPISAVEAEVTGLLSLWLHRIVQNNNEAALAILINLMDSIVEQKVLSTRAIGDLLREWQDLAGIASLNPNSSMAAIIIHDMISLAGRTKNITLWTNTVHGAAKIVRLTVEQYGTRYAFPILFPLLEAGRKLLAAEIKFAASSEASEFRQKALFIILKECVSIGEFAARTSIMGTTYDVINEFYQCWHDDSTLNYKIKSAKKFFQLLLLFWQKKMARHAKRQMPEQTPLLEPVLLSETDLQQFRFM